MRIRRSGPVILAGVIASACADGIDPAASLVATLTVVDPAHHVQGSGHVQQAAGLREFTFHAVERADGSAGGSYKIVLANGLFFEVDVTCTKVSGSTGWVAGSIRATNSGAVVLGSVSTVFVVDNGEGEGAPADIVSLATFNGAAGADLVFCANQPLALPQLIVTHGNVQVR